MGLEEAVRLHPSHLQTYARCPAKYHYEYVEKVVPAFHMWAKLKGTIVHNTLFHGPSQFNAIFDSIIIEAQREAPILETPERIEKDRLPMEQAILEYDKFMVKHNVITVERELTLRYKVCGVPFEGTLDHLIQLPDTPEGMVDIVDYKTGLKWGKEALNRNLQFGHYYMAARQNDYHVHRVYWGHFKDLVRWKSDGKEAVRGELRGPFLYPLYITDNDIPMIVDWTVALVTQIKTKKPFFAANDQVCKMCEFSEHCPTFKIGYQDPTKAQLLDEEDRLMEQWKDALTKGNAEGARDIGEDIIRKGK